MTCGVTRPPFFNTPYNLEESILEGDIGSSQNITTRQVTLIGSIRGGKKVSLKESYISEKVRASEEIIAKYTTMNSLHSLSAELFHSRVSIATTEQSLTAVQSSIDRIISNGPISLTAVTVSEIEAEQTLFCQGCSRIGAIIARWTTRLIHCPQIDSITCHGKLALEVSTVSGLVEADYIQPLVEVRILNTLRINRGDVALRGGFVKELILKKGSAPEQYTQPHHLKRIERRAHTHKKRKRGLPKPQPAYQKPALQRILLTEGAHLERLYNEEKVEVTIHNSCTLEGKTLPFLYAQLLHPHSFPDAIVRLISDYVAPSYTFIREKNFF